MYVRAFHLDPAMVTLHWSQGVNSINSLTHVHTSKVPIALTLNLLQLSSLHQQFDTGAAYASVVPVWIAAAIGVCFVLTLTFALWLVPAWLRRDPERPLGQIVLGALASSAVTKCILDGGPLAYDAVVGAITLFLLLHDRAIAHSRLKRGFTPVMTMLLWVAAVAAYSPGALQGQLTEALKRTLLYLAIGASGVKVCWPRLTPRAGSWIGATCLAAWMCFVMADVRARVVPLLQQAPSTWVSLRDGPRLMSARGPRVADAYLENADDPLRARFTSVTERTDLATGMLAEAIPLRATEHLAFQDDASLRFVRAEFSEEGRIRLQVEFDAALGPVLFSDGRRNQVTENERFVAYFAFDRAARRAGLGEYILIPYLQYRDNPVMSAEAE
jgi:hypothetical protein